MVGLNLALYLLLPMRCRTSFISEVTSHSISRCCTLEPDSSQPWWHIVIYTFSACMPQIPSVLFGVYLIMTDIDCVCTPTPDPEKEMHCRN